MSFIRTLTYAAVGFAITVAPLAAKEDNTPAVCYAVMTVAQYSVLATEETGQIKSTDAAAVLVAGAEKLKAWERRAFAVNTRVDVFLAMQAAWSNAKAAMKAATWCFDNAPREETL